MSVTHRLPSRLLLALLALTAGPALAADSAPDYTLTGHVDLVSRYFLRGLTKTYGNGPALGNQFADAPESDKPALQWGADFADASGFYLGYWGSQVNYSYEQLGKSYDDPSITDFQHRKSIENDFYGGYTGSVGEVGYTVGATYYYYLRGQASNALESKLGLSYGPLSFSAQTLLKDTVWGNQGDTYWSAVYTQPLDHGITFTANLGFYSYKKEGKYLGTVDTRSGAGCAADEVFNVSGCYAGSGSVTSGGFRHLILGISQPISSTALVWGLQGIIGGKNRFDISQSNKLLLTLGYGF